MSSRFIPGCLAQVAHQRGRRWALALTHFQALRAARLRLPSATGVLVWKDDVRIHSLDSLFGLCYGVTACRFACA